MGQEALLPKHPFLTVDTQTAICLEGRAEAPELLSGDLQIVCLADETKLVQGPPYGHRQTAPPHCTLWLPSFLPSLYVSV